MSKADVRWVELGFLPVFVGYCPTAAARERALTELGIEVPPINLETCGARCEWWDRPDNEDVILITLAPRAVKYSMPQVAGIIAHECMHAWRFIRQIMGEDEPSTEFEAYAMQAMVQGIVTFHAQAHRKPWAGA